MKSVFEFRLKGKDWSSLWAMYWVPTLLLQGLSLMVKGPSDRASNSLGYLGLSLCIAYLQTLVSSWFQIPIMKAQLAQLTVAGKRFGFHGDSLDFVKLNAVGFLLSVVTIGVYGPWYIRRILQYLASVTTFDGEKAEFMGRGSRLLGIFAVAIGIGTAIIIAVALPMVLVFKGGSSDQIALMLGIITFLLVFLLVCPLSYLIYHWSVNFQWKSATLRWRTDLWRSSGFLAGQILLALVTFGIYAPAAFLRLYRYFTARTLVDEQGVIRVKLRFEGNLVQGFGLFWGQSLLTVLSLGFYWPWALERLGAWMASSTFAEELTPPVPDEPRALTTD